jgi:hypothetical protein
MSNTLFNNHPLINNSNQYFYEKKYLSISSEDRDFSKYPNSAEFEIMLPQEYLNVVSARLYSWSFPANYNVFSELNANVSMTFKFDELYNPGAVGVSDPLLEGIFAALYYNIDKEYVVVIESGFYNPDQMVTELTNKFNESVTNYILKFFNDNEIEYATAKSLFKQYDRFNIVYNTVQQKIWFGNTADKFTLTNDSSLFFKSDFIDPRCIKKRILPDFSSWGLPGYLGFARCPATSDSGTNLIGDPSLSTEFNVPRFYYGEVVTNSGDNGYWLLPGAPNATVYFLQAPLKISFMGPAYIYMEVEGMNCIDETSPWNLSEYTAHTNRTNGIVNSSFAKIPVPTTPISQWFDNDMGPYKYWNPPAERLGKFKFKFRYHNGQLVDFGQFDYSFMIEFNLLKPQPERSYSIRNAFDLAQTQSFGSKFI